MNVVQIIRADGTTEDVNRKMKLAEMQKIVGGYIEVAMCKLPHRAIVCNEDGIALKLPVNKIATELLHERMRGSIVLGNVLLVKK